MKTKKFNKISKNDLKNIKGGLKVAFGTSGCTVYNEYAELCAQL